MRILRFIVDDQTIKMDKTCNFDNIVLGTKGYLLAQFKFSQEWRSYYKAGKFTVLGKTYYAPIIGNKCYIPSEALVWTNFEVAVIGRNKGSQITTNAVKIYQEKG